MIRHPIQVTIHDDPAKVEVGYDGDTVDVTPAVDAITFSLDATGAVLHLSCTARLGDALRFPVREVVAYTPADPEELEKAISAATLDGIILTTGASSTPGARLEAHLRAVLGLEP